MSEIKNVRVGVGIFIFKDGKFLMMKRHGAHGEGTWSVPGGHQEFGESFLDTAKRETLEETGVTISHPRFGAVTNDYFEAEGKHYVTIWVLADYESGEATIMEPEKCTEQGWFDFDNLPAPLFLPWQQLLHSDFIDAIKKELVK